MGLGGLGACYAHNKISRVRLSLRGLEDENVGEKESLELTD